MILLQGCGEKAYRRETIFVGSHVVRDLFEPIEESILVSYFASDHGGHVK